MFRAKELQRACPRSQAWLMQVFDTAAAAPARNGQRAALCRKRASPKHRPSQRQFSTSRGARQEAHAEAAKDPENIETVVRQAKATFGDTLPKGYLTHEEYRLYERLYGSPLRDTRAEDIGIPEAKEEVVEEDGVYVVKHALLETESGALEGVAYTVEETVAVEKGDDAAEAQEAADAAELDPQDGIPELAENQKEFINAVARNKREYKALMKLQRDFEAASLAAAVEEEQRIQEQEGQEHDKDKAEAEKAAEAEAAAAEGEYLEGEAFEVPDEPVAVTTSRERRLHPLTVEGWSRTDPSTVHLPKHEFVEPITELLRRTDTKHIREAAEKAFGGRGLPLSPSSLRQQGGAASQKGLTIEAGHHRMSDIEADVFLATVMPAIYTTATSTLVEVRRRLGSSWIPNLLSKPEGQPLRVLDVGGGGAGLKAWDDIFEAEVRALEEAGKLPASVTDDYAVEKSAVVGAHALQLRASAFLENTTLLPRLPDLLHSAENVSRHLDAPETLQPRKKYDVIIASHTLLPTKPQFRRANVANLWAMLNPEGGVLIILEKGHPRGFEAVADARQRILDDLMIAPGRSADMAEEGDDFYSEPARPSLPTRSPGMIIAPCTNHGKCPMYLQPGLTSGRKDFCRFSQRFIRPPFLQKVVAKPSTARNHEDVDFSYVAVQRGVQMGPVDEPVRTQPIVQGKEASDAAFKGFEKVMVDGSDPAVLPPHTLSLPRLIMPPLKRHGHVIMDMCTPSGQLERWTVPKSLSKQAYHDARKSQWGDLWALGAKSRVVRAARVGKKRPGKDDEEDDVEEGNGKGKGNNKSQDMDGDEEGLEDAIRSRLKPGPKSIEDRLIEELKEEMEKDGVKWIDPRKAKA